MSRDFLVILIIFEKSICKPGAARVCSPREYLCYFADLSLFSIIHDKDVDFDQNNRNIWIKYTEINYEVISIEHWVPKLFSFFTPYHILTVMDYLKHCGHLRHHGVDK